MHRNLKCIILFSVFLLLVGFGYPNLYSVWSGKVLHVGVKNEKTINKLIAGMNETDATPESIFFNGHPVIYDTDSNTIYLSQNVDDTSFSGELVSKGRDLLWQEDPLLRKKTEAISDGSSFSLYQINKKKAEYHRYNLVFTGMPIMELTVEDTYEDVINYLDKEVSVAKIRVEDPYHQELDYQTAEGKFYIRGDGSYFDQYEKRSFKLRLTDKKKSFLGLREDDDWILNGLYDDAGMIHNKLSYELWNEMAVNNNISKDYSTNMEYMELFIDGKYEGVYGLTERIDKKELSLDKNDVLYKCRSYRVADDHNFTNDMTDDLRPVFILKYPKDYEEADWEPIKLWSDMFCKERFDTYEEGAATLNMENAIDYNLYCLLISGSDNMRKNLFFIADREKDGTYKMIKVPWDMNATWGNPWITMPEANYTLYDPGTITGTDTWCTDIGTLQYYDEKQIAMLQLERWKELRSSFFTKEHIYSILDEQFGYLYDTGAYRRNYQRFPNGVEYWDDYYIYEYAEKRLEFLDGYFEKLSQAAYGENVYVFDGVDYTAEFNPRYYWFHNEANMEELYGVYNEEAALQHYALYGKPFGLVGKRPEE